MCTYITTNYYNIIFDLLIAFIGAFLGLGSALFLQKSLSNSQARKSIGNIIDELDVFFIDLIGVLTDINSSKSLTYDTPESEIEIFAMVPKKLAYAIYVPIWETFVKTGNILEFKNKVYFDDLILLYSNIQKLSNMINWFVENEIILNTKEDRIDKLKIIIDQCLYLKNYLNYKPKLNKLFKNKTSYYHEET